MRSMSLLARMMRPTNIYYRPVRKLYKTFFQNIFQRLLSVSQEEELTRRNYDIWREIFSGAVKQGLENPVYKEELAKVLDENKNSPILIYPSLIHWNHYLFQRPHHIFTQMARKGVTVLFCTPKPQDDGVKVFKKVAPHLYLCESMACVAPLQNHPVWVWIGWTPAMAILPYFKQARVIYEYIDELEVFACYCDHMVRDHLKLLKRSDIVLASADNLFDSVSARRKDALLVPNGVAFDDFSVAGTPELPNDMAPIVQKKKPIVGYYGAIARWLDYDLLRKLVEAMPEIEFVFIGPDHDGGSKALPRSANMSWLGPKRYHELKNYLSLFTAAIIPFAKNRVTESVSPLKLFEYMAGGKPVVATDLREIRKYSPVLTASSEREWVNQITKACELSKNRNFVEKLKATAQDNSWSNRTDSVIARMKKMEAAERSLRS